MDFSKTPGPPTGKDKKENSDKSSKTVKKKRLSLTRKLIWREKFSHDFSTPESSPISHPNLQSTPVNYIDGVVPIIRLPLPPRSLSRHSSASSLDQVGSDVNCGRDSSLDWDFYTEPPTYSDTLSCSRTDTIMSKEESKIFKSVSADDLKGAAGGITEQQSQEDIRKKMSQANKELLELRTKLNDMMTDYTHSHVRKGNVSLVDSKLEKIANVRSEFRSKVRSYKQTFENVHPENCKIVESQLNTIMQSVEDHANKIWTKVEEIQAREQPPAQQQHQPWNQPWN